MLTRGREGLRRDRENEVHAPYINWHVMASDLGTLAPAQVPRIRKGKKNCTDETNSTIHGVSLFK